MSRTLSIGKVGPGPDFSGSGPFSISTPPAATSACLSDARLRSLISARGASLRWAIRCYGWGYLGRFGSLWSRVAPWALAEKKSGVRPNGLGSDRRMGCERRDVGLARHRDAPGALGHAADRPAPARGSRAVATLALFLWTPRSSIAARLPTSLLTPLAAWRLAPGSGAWPLARSFEWGEHPR